MLPGQAGRRTGDYNPTAVQRRAGQLGTEVLESFPSREGLFQTAAALGLAGSAFMGVGVPAAIGLAATALIGRGMVSKRVQNFLMGQTKFQRLNRTRFNRYKKELVDAGVSEDVAEFMLKSPGIAARRSAAIGGANDAS